MKNVIWLVMLLAFLSGGVVYAERQGTIEITWEYPNPDQDLAGFRIYDKDGTKTTEITMTAQEVLNSPEYPKLQHTGPTIIKTGLDEELTMTAFDSSGKESSHSIPFLAKTYPAVPSNPAGVVK